METSKGLNSWSVMIRELTQGRELAKQLQNHLDPSTPHETREYLIQKILSTYNKLLHMTNLPCNTFFPMDPNSSQISFHGGPASEPPCSLSPCSDLDNRGRPSKRRRTLPKWVKTVKVSTEEGGGEGDLFDGYRWRKYGQKVILGATFPRGYYRCTHRYTGGCCAAKQVQKSSEDPTLFHIIYKGHHTCSQRIHINQPSTNTNPPPIFSGPLHPLKPDPAQPNPQQEKQNHQTPRFVQPQLKVETLDIDPIFSAFLGNAAEFVSAPPATFDSSHLPMGKTGGNDIWMSESDVNNKKGGLGSDSPFGRFEFTLDELGIGPNIPFDDPEFFWVFGFQNVDRIREIEKRNSAP